MTREEVKVEFGGLTHDHLNVDKQDMCHTNENLPVVGADKIASAASNATSNAQNASQDNPTALSTIAILRRHTMYDSLVLVKRYRPGLSGYTLEFPTSEPNGKQPQKEHSKDCCKTKLISVYLDGDDPIYLSQEKKRRNSLSSDGEVVHVPMNGLLDRLENYENHGIAIDGRVYAFAMGLKTAEKFLTISSMKEIQETPPL